MDARASLEKLTKWRTFFASWQLGTRTKGDPELQAVKDHREVTILLRAEVTTLVGLLIEKGVFTQEEFTAALAREAEQLSADYSRRWRGVEATPDGLAYDLAVIREHGTMEGWKP
jgi:hypothetical protein